MYLFTDSMKVATAILVACVLAISEGEETTQSLSEKDTTFVTLTITSSLTEKDTSLGKPKETFEESSSSLPKKGTSLENPMKSTSSLPKKDTTMEHPKKRTSSLLEKETTLEMSKVITDIRPRNLLENPKRTSKKRPSSEIGPRCFNCIEDFFDDSSSEEVEIYANMSIPTPAPDPPTVVYPITPPPVVCPTPPPCPPPVVCPAPPPPTTCAPAVVCPPLPPPEHCTPSPTTCEYQVNRVTVSEDNGDGDLHKFCFNPFNLLQGQGCCVAIKIMKKGIQLIVHYLESVIEKISIPGLAEFPDCIKVPQFYTMLPGFCISLNVEKRNETFLSGCASMHFDQLPTEGLRTSCFRINKNKCDC